MFLARSGGIPLFCISISVFLAALSSARSASAAWKIASSPLVSAWAGKVAPDCPLAEYPRPQMLRDRFLILNGLWDYCLSPQDVTALPSQYEGNILVPFPYESALSGIGKASPNQKILWYHRIFTVPPAWSGSGATRIILHFGAVNWNCSVYVNKHLAANHTGGYTAFETDITDLLQPGSNDLVLSVQNPLKVDQADAQVVGKQRLHPGGIFYTAATGIWQTVWMEPVPRTYIIGLKETPNIDTGTLHLEITTSAPSDVTVEASEGPTKVTQTVGKSGSTIDLHLPNAHLWSPADPYLYDLNVSLTDNGNTVDQVRSYFGMRKVALSQNSKGQTQIFLNNQFLLEIGLLDQGYWPDGIYTAPTDEALQSDIVTAKKLNYNLLRKHAKVEPARWYYWADKLGILVWQDMPQAFGGEPKGSGLTEQSKEQWLTEWKSEVTELYNFPSIVVWTLFNEAWGQHDTEEIVNITRKLDSSRLINAASGWIDRHLGDIHDCHAYPGPWSDFPEATRAAVNGEFGGVTEDIPNHRWNHSTFGYGNVLQNKEEATRRYVDLLKAAYRLYHERGTSAFVYTQLTDVEGEINGILTYDRAEIKLDEQKLQEANAGNFPNAEESTPDKPKQ